MLQRSEIDRADWPLRPNGARRRATASGELDKGRISRPSGRVARLFLLAVIAVPTLFVSSPTYATYASSLPDIRQITDPIPSDTIVYASDGTSVLADLHPPGYQHYPELLSAMGSYLPDAIVAIEDHNFYQEPGVDPTSVVRAALVDWKAKGSLQGASTITQQLAKIRLVGDQPTLDRKVREALLSLELERTYSKAQILEQYLNVVSFGDSAVGSAAAAQIFFHTKTSALDLAQAAMLAGLVRGPTYYSPMLDWTNAKARQLEVLNAMVSDKTTTQAKADTAYAEDVSP